MVEAQATDIDHLLGVLLDAISEHGYAVPVVLTVSGLTIEGLAVSDTEFVERFNRELHRRGNASVVDPPALWAGQERETERMRRQSALDPLLNEDFDPYADAAWRPSWPKHVQIVDVTVNAGSSLLHLPFWRGRLSSVSGWSLGPRDTVEDRQDSTASTEAGSKTTLGSI
jgi:hypothetical protein